MRITVFGATGGTGRRLVRQALDAGHAVTAVVRDPARLPIQAAALTVRTGHVPDAADSFLTRAGVKPLVRTLMPGQLDDYARTDAAVSGSGLDWTIVRPGWLNNGAHRAYRTSLDHGTPGANSISRHDLADFLLPADDSTIGHAVFIGY
jgi:uncharacterized protein YbjT (DUF2867 family)